MTLSDIGCLRLDWPRDLFAFVGRYQLELEQMRKECRDRFGPAASGPCPTCDKYIKVNLGKHVALYHLDLAQLWRCPVPWCPVWKGDITRLCGPHAQGTQHTLLWKSRRRPTDCCRSVRKFYYPGPRKWPVSMTRTLCQLPCHQIG